uniref:ShKT domain-containing protein n=1 Tax=Hemiselmis andersenii TaxID=464988 RepID=A0A6U2BCF6_HEMAN
MAAGTALALYSSLAAAFCLLLLLTLPSSPFSALRSNPLPTALEETIVVLPPDTPASDVKQLPMMLTPGTAVTVPVCTMGSCRQYEACMDRWDFSTDHGSCDVYGDWTKRMGYCESDKDVFGTLASVACPVSCDTCPLGKCYIRDSNTLMQCAGGKLGRRRR